jgi:hypothetical protein
VTVSVLDADVDVHDLVVTESGVVVVAVRRSSRALEVGLAGRTLRAVATVAPGAVAACAFATCPVAPREIPPDALLMAAVVVAVPAE